MPCNIPGPNAPEIWGVLTAIGPPMAGSLRSKRLNPWHQSHRMGEGLEPCLQPVLSGQAHPADSFHLHLHFSHYLQASMYYTVAYGAP
ncbi:hypothetical protein K439DRAFT_878483 [Ramaria rubella]|nr:hypothetical protein K439DRAFT_878483 [Ramaria rubella]